MLLDIIKYQGILSPPTINSLQENQHFPFQFQLQACTLGMFLETHIKG